MANYNNAQSLQRELTALKGLNDFVVERIYNRIVKVEKSLYNYVNEMEQTGIPSEICKDFREKYYVVDSNNFKILKERITNYDLPQIKDQINRIVQQFNAIHRNVGSVPLKKIEPVQHPSIKNFNVRSGETQNYKMQLDALSDFMKFLDTQQKEIVQTISDYKKCCNNLLSWGVPKEFVGRYSQLASYNINRLKGIVSHIIDDDSKQLKTVFSSILSPYQFLGYSYSGAPTIQSSFQESAQQLGDAVYSQPANMKEFRSEVHTEKVVSSSTIEKEKVIYTDPKGEHLPPYETNINSSRIEDDFGIDNFEKGTGKANRLKDINGKLNELFGEWRSVAHEKGGTDFVFDGLLRNSDLDDSKWWDSPLRIAFITKDPHFEGNYNIGDLDGEDYRKYNILELSIDHRFWRNILTWAYGIIRTAKGGYPDYDEASKYSKREFIYNSIPIALVNIKKEAGDPTVEDTTLRRFAREYKDYLKQELQGILRPNVLVCGATSGIVMDEIYDEYDFIKMDNEGYIHYCKDRDILLIASYHPKARMGNEDLYNGLMRAYSLFLEEYKFPRN